MIIFLKNKHTLQVDDFFFKCSVGKNGVSKNKIEGDQKTPRGVFEIGHLYYRKSRIKKIFSPLKLIGINKSMGWCDDANSKNYYNKLIKVNKNLKHEKLFRKDNNYDLLIPIKYNFKKRILGLGSCIFFHITEKYKPTAGCIALAKKDFLIMIRLLNKKSKIKIF